MINRQETTASQKNSKFYIKFWDVVKEPLCASNKESFIVGELSTSQKQAIIKLIKKKDRDKRLATYLTSKCRHETNLEGNCLSLIKCYYYH